MSHTQRYILIIAVLTLLRFIAGAVLPLSCDETYYWLWSRHLAAGYFDDPPMIAGDPPRDSVVWRQPVRPALCFFVVIGRRVGRCGRAGASRCAARTRACGPASFSTPRSWSRSRPSQRPRCARPCVRGPVASRPRQGRGDGQGLVVVARSALPRPRPDDQNTAFFRGLRRPRLAAATPSMRRWLLSPWPYAGGVPAVVIFLPNLLWNAQPLGDVRAAGQPDGIGPLGHALPRRVPSAG